MQTLFAYCDVHGTYKTFDAVVREEFIPTPCPHCGDPMVSRFDPDVIYYSLREAGFAAVRIDAKGKVISPKSIATPQQTADDSSRIAADIARIREADNKIGSEPDDDDVLRQLQLAIKLKSKISVVLDLGSGKQVAYLVEPVGLANGRLRAKDRKADVERTLPISSIVSIELL